MNSKFFLERDKKRIHEAVKLAEARTSGEIVPVVAMKSVRYAWLACSLGLLGLVAGTVAGLLLSYYWPFAAELRTILELQAAGLLIGALLGSWAPVMRLLLGKDWIDEEVQAAAQLAFVREGLFNTRDRTGILIFISMRERRVVVLADKGINEKVSAGYWDEEVAKIILGIRTGTAGDALVTVIGEMGEKLAEHFPRKDDDSNELTDKLRLQ